MAYNDNQKDYPLPVNGKSNRKSSELLPKYFRTESNEKFLNSTLDQVTTPGTAKKLNGYFGRKTAAAYTPNDNYLSDVSTNRTNYQLEPALVSKDLLGNVLFYKDYNDFRNQLDILGGTTANESLFNSQEYYAWDSGVDWDKLTNFREYYWLPSGPAPISIFGQSDEVTSTYTVNSVDNAGNKGYTFNGELTQNPTLELYRGQTYIFDIGTPGLPFTIRTSRLIESDNEFATGVTNAGVDNGVVTFTVPLSAPDRLYYVSETDVNTGGMFRIAEIESNTSIAVDSDILGKKTYTSANGTVLMNGMKLNFTGTVTPEKYATGNWYVEGVGDKIILIQDTDLVIPQTYSADIEVLFDANNFDNLPYGTASSYAGTKDYVVINRASPDKNAWTRNNRWFHKSVLEKTATLNGQIFDIDQSARAKRPIIEFNAGIKLQEFGTDAKESNVDLIDTFTTDVFSTINGKEGYNIDGVDVTNGMRILFTADPDLLVKDRIYKVKFIKHNSTVAQIALVEETDTLPITNQVALITKGTNAGKQFYYNGIMWKTAQLKTKINQQPLFELYDGNGISYTDATTYPVSDFSGNKIFSYKVGTGNNDIELGFPVTYRALENVGDITFDFNLVTESFNYQINNTPQTRTTDIGFYRVYTDINSFTYGNGWKKANTNTVSKVIRQYDVITAQSDFAIDVYNNSSTLTDLKVAVQVNNTWKFNYTLVDVNGNKTVRFTTAIPANSTVVIKTSSDTIKNNNGYYEFPHAMEKNPQNENLNTFTLGEVNDHVNSMIEDLPGFVGQFPGNSNLGNLGNISNYGRKFLQYSGSPNIAVYHATDKDANIVKAVDYARREYRKFKRSFIQVADTLGYDGPVKQHVDKILHEIQKDKINTDSYYFSDMIPFEGYKRLEFTVYDTQNNFFSLSEVYSLSSLSSKAVLVYQNGVQLIHNKDYTFNTDGFVVITATKVKDDLIEIYEFENTDGCYVPPTPTKLGLYPSYYPAIIDDTTYQTTTRVIQGHDGSKVVAYMDYRDQLLLELEKRIYNNIKVTYDTTRLDIHDFIPSINRDTKFTKSQIDNAMLRDFVQWSESLGGLDYTSSDFYSRANSFTWNYSEMATVDEKPTQGFWRSVYKTAYDTDRPHTHPWEMLGFTIMPTWWETVYGPAPYTSNNLVMWEDIQEGKVKKPGVPVEVITKYKRKKLLNHIPVNEAGNLLSPQEAGYTSGFVPESIASSFKFGDESPTETAWRRSGEYPFSLIKAWILNQPHKIIGLGFDTSRMKKSLAGQWIYTASEKALSLTDVVYPTSITDTVSTHTSGLINYITDYLNSEAPIDIATYKEKFNLVKNQLGIKLGSFSDKEKLKFILDSRTPFNKGNVFLPQENYNIFLNKSSPLAVSSYSGVMIEKAPGGFIIRGYDNTNPTFAYNQPQITISDPNINVGGISESFLEWASGQKYLVGSNVRDSNKFFRVKEEHTSTSSFDANKFQTLAELPTIGGVTAVYRKTFSNDKTIVPYGTLLTTIQDVVDFLLGYGNCLEQSGFTFDFYNKESQIVEDWKISTKEFLYFTTQNWAAGTVLSVSPAATKLELKTSYAVVDNLYDSFYDYSILNASGEKITEELVRLNRDSSTFLLQLKNTADGLYHAILPQVQYEHVAVLDNTSVFKDVVYSPATGYRQERIKVLGYVASGWDGSLNIPGFIFDQAEVTQWTQWTDFAIGDVVKYKEFYYTASVDIQGTETFDTKSWSRLDKKPTPKLMTNFDYKINQFADFYDLDSDNFDTAQQKMAQHLIGYQKRQYLENIINDEVSQYKFYQGMIADKGTRNAIDKLFDSLASADKDSVDFYEEWAIKSAQYGASTGFEEIEYQLDEANFKLEPQPIKLVDVVPTATTDLTYRIPHYDVFLKPVNYETTLLPTKYLNDEYVKTVGYVTGEDVNRAVSTTSGIIGFSTSDLDKGSYIWVATENQTWDVLKHLDSDIIIQTITQEAQTITLNCDKTVDLAVNDIIGIYNIDQIVGTDTTATTVEAFYNITDVFNNKIEITSELADWEKLASLTNLNGIITKFESQRVSTLASANILSTKNLQASEVVWVDDDDTGKWKVIKNSPVYSQAQVIKSSIVLDSTQHNFGHSIAVNESNTLLAVGIPDKGNGEVHVYKRSSDANNLVFDQTVKAPSTYVDTYDGSTEITSQKFGESVSFSPDGKYLIVGSPHASNVKTAYKGIYVEGNNYNKNDIIKYGPNLFKAIAVIDGAVGSIPYTTFDSYADIVSDTDSTLINLLQTGNYKLNSKPNTTHLLIRAPKQAYEGSKAGDSIVLKWNTYSNLNIQGYNVAVEPFDGQFTPITGAFLTDTHPIVDKVENVLHIANFQNLPGVGQTVNSAVASGTVVYVGDSDGAAIVYIKDVNGSFATTGQIFIGDIAVGDYTEDYTNPSSNVGGYWMITTPAYETSADSSNIFVDPGHGLVYVDIIKEGSGRTPNYFYNIQDNIQAIGTKTSLNDQISFIESFTYEGDPGEVFAVQPSNQWAIRVPKAFSDTKTTGDDFYLKVDNQSGVVDLTGTAFTFDILNKQHTIADVWDGYIDFVFDNFSTLNQLPFEPAIGSIVRDASSGATAEVVFYKRQFNDVRIYVKNVTGTWSLGDNWGQTSDIIRQGSPDRTMGEVKAVSLGTTEVGKIFVITEATNFASVATTELLDKEYWIYNEITLQGIARGANIPSSNNNDWSQVNNLVASNSANATGSGLTQEGMVSVYSISEVNQFEHNNSYVVPERENYKKFGDEIQVTQTGTGVNALYRLAVASNGNNTESNPGSIHFIKHGRENTVGNTYVSYDWQLDINPLFRGEFSITTFYKVNEIVSYNKELYSANQNIASGSAFLSANWTKLTSTTTHVGYIPSTTDQLVTGEGIYTPEGGVRDFAKQFDQDKLGQVLITSTKIQGNDSTGSRAVNVYRQVNGQFTISQTITAPYTDVSTDTLTGYGDAIAISADGTLIAVGEPYNNSSAITQGKVYIYKQTSGTFVLSQTLTSHNNEVAEQFGSAVGFDGNVLAVTSLQGDIDKPTIYDADTTYFDSKFTNFKTVLMDSGVIYTYERINETLVYAEEFMFDESNAMMFGKNILVSNNHVYASMPQMTDYNTYQGMVVDYRKILGTTAWTTHRSPLDQVDLSNVKSAFLYNTKTNTLVTDIDLIDPVQGKIPGPAEQELSFKTYYDPASYNIGDTSVVVDTYGGWTNDTVGKLWWDLSAVKYYNYYQNDITYQTNFWSEVFPGTDIAIWEWVESDVLPSEWDTLADTEQGIAQGISGLSKYGDTAYSQQLVWDNISNSTSTKYYFWALNKKTTPNVDFRSLSASSVQQLIKDPAGAGYKFAALMSKDRFALYNVASLMDDKNIALNIRYWTTTNKKQNIHNEYQMIAQGVPTSKPNRDIERKWFDSLIGYDVKDRLVPDPALSVKLKYGIQNRPRQGLFVNKSEAFKQVIERANDVLKNNIIVDEFDISDLVKSDPAPSVSTQLYDAVIETFEDLAFLGIGNKTSPTLTPTIIDGSITQVLITATGRGYIDSTYTSGIRKGPKITVTGIGSDAEVECTLNELGQIATVNIINAGTGYDENTTITVRNFSALVSSDSNVANKWSIYELIDGKWNRSVSQRYDTNLYWSYVNWYAPGYNMFTQVTNLIEASYLLTGLNNDIGDTVKISNIGSGGWLLLEKINNTVSDDYTVNYKTIGKQNATIMFADTLYNVGKSKVGFDSNNYDSVFFDAQPVTESRIILETLRDKIFVDNLEVEYNKLFLSSVRYAFSEQPNIDWAFKSSFVKAQHNLGDLAQKVTFKNDNLESYQTYINEVKPYKTKIREFVSSYEKVDLTNTTVSDFDLPPKYSLATQKIEASTAKVANEVIYGQRDMSVYPDKHWYDNAGYEITSVEIGNPGTLYNLPPIVKFEGNSGTGATAKAYLNNGKISKIAVLTPGKGYLSAPTVLLDGGLGTGGTIAKATAVLGNGTARGTTVKFKFDRVSGTYYITTLATTETFTGTGTKFKYNLKWPMDRKNTSTTVVVTGVELLRSEYTFTNIKDVTKGYDRELGQVTFTTPPKLGAAITITYSKDATLLDAQDRIGLLYNPITGMIGKDISQLMEGVDYGGVEIKSFGFEGSAGWDTDPFFTETFDTYDNTYEDLVFQLDGSTATLTWASALETGVVYNVYRNNVRIDDPYYNDSSEATNPNAKMLSIIGAGQTELNLQNLGIDANNDDTFIIRKTTSDGSFKPDVTSYDTLLDGGTTLYDTARGIAASEIVVDGDGFVTPITGKGPEELVNGQILDTMDLKVVHRAVDGGSTIYSDVYWTDGVTDTFNLGGHPNSADAVFVRLDNVKVSPSLYTVNYATNTITFATAPVIRKLLNIIVMGEAGQKILDINKFTGDGSSVEFITNVEWQTDMTHFVNINGVAQSVTIFSAGDSYGVDKGYAGIRFSTAPALDAVIDYGLFYAIGTNFSQVASQTFTADGSTKTYTLATTPIGSTPVANQTIVKVNGVILNSGYSDRHVITSSLQYQLQNWQLGFNTIRGEDIEVYLDGVKLTRNIEYKWDSANNIVNVTANVATAGQVLDVFLIADGDYAFGYVGIEPGPDSSTKFIATPGIIYFDNAPALDATVEVVTFSNHDILDIERIKYNVISRTSVSEGTVDFQEYTLLTNGFVKLRKPVNNSKYVWIVLNGVQLTPVIDYYVTEDKNHIKVTKPISTSDTIELIHFTAPPTLQKFGFRQFKDMLNRTHYKRMDDSNKYMLAEALNWSDMRINLLDASGLPTPNKTSKIPGVVFIDGERIEYFVKQNNTLRQIRRGTLGTGVKSTYPAGTSVEEQSIGQNIPYADETLTQVLTADGTSTAYELDFIPTSVNEFELFVAGKRMRKTAIAIFNPATDLDSPEGDTTSAAEFSIDGTTSTLTLATAPLENQKIIIVRKQGKLWTDPGTSLTRQENDIARFLRTKVTELVK
tara:strand:+ start:16317 stop:31109 length:14793 start_codon:yes stop_codon:yes gene_type:complete